MNTDTNYREYCLLDCLATINACEKELEDMKEYGILEHYNKIVMPLTSIVYNLNRKGMKVDEERRQYAIKSMRNELEYLQYKINDMVGKEVNIRGNNLKDFLYQELGLKCGKSTGSLDTNAVTKLMDNYPELAYLFESIKEAKHTAHIISSFLTKIYPDKDGIVYPNYKIGPVTGRLACKKPNFQNVPPGVSRNMYVSRPGKVFIYADYSQLEVRILAILANLIEMIKVLDSGGDFHSYNAKAIFKTETPSSVHRRIAKNVFFGIVSYGGTPEGLKGRMEKDLHDVSLQELKNLVNEYFDANPGIKRNRELIEVQLASKKMLKNVFGRIRIFFDNFKDAIRAAYNFPVQSAAADVKNLQAIEVEQYYPNMLVLDVHDALMWEVEEEIVEEVGKHIKSILEAPIPELKNYCFPVNMKIGTSWGDM